MDSLEDTHWDVLISGTGIQQSLLALALSRSEKKVLQVDDNEFYGGAEAAFSLQEAESWVKTLDSAHSNALFSNASIWRTDGENEEHGSSILSPSRAYSLALAPQLIYTDSALLTALISSQTYKQLDFVAMGHWFVYAREQGLVRIPTTREDVVFSDGNLDLRSKRAVMRVLRFLVDYESQTEVWEPYKDRSLSELLLDCFKLPVELHGIFHALALSLDPPDRNLTSIALPRLARHLRSTGRLGPGFSSVIPKWGGLSEVAQVACRAGAVGGAVYVLGKGLKTLGDGDEAHVGAILSDGEKVMTSHIALQEQTLDKSAEAVHRSISVISSSLPTLFPALAEGGPPPAGAVVFFPADSITRNQPPVYLIVHSSETGECPRGQSIIYTSTLGLHTLAEQAVGCLLSLADEGSSARVLWCLKYEQRQGTSQLNDSPEKTKFPSPSLNLAFDDAILGHVKSAWQTIIGSEESSDFLVFDDRNKDAEDDEST